MDAQVGRVGTLDTPVAYSPQLEDVILPRKDTRVRVMRGLAEYRRRSLPASDAEAKR